MSNVTTEVGAIEVATKLAELVERAPAGGLFHDVTLSVVGGLEVPGFCGLSGFELRTREGKTFFVRVEETR